MGIELNMRPILSPNHIAYRFWGHAVISSYRFIANNIIGMCFSYFKNIRFIKFCHAVFRSKMIYSSSFFGHISDIVDLCSKPEMFWIYTCRIIASMKASLAFFYFSVMHFIRHPMGRQCSSRITHSNGSISTRIFRTKPYPAGAGFIDFIPESFHCLELSQPISGVH